MMFFLLLLVCVSLTSAAKFPVESCNGTTVKSSIIGGRLVSSIWKKQATSDGSCIWVIPVEDSSNVYLIHKQDHCISCEDGLCSRRPTVSASTLQCSWYLGYDCDYHEADTSNSDLPCQPLKDLCSESIEKREVIAGRLVAQRFQQITTSKCEWVLFGGTKEKYIRKSDCSSCKTSSDGFVSCVGPALLQPPKDCDVYLGIDCNYHIVSKLSKLKFCQQGCSKTKVVEETIGGVDITQKWKQMLVPTARGRQCKWVLDGSSLQKYVVAEECTTCTWEANNQVACLAYPLVQVDESCAVHIASNCRHYVVDPLDKSKPCKPECHQSDLVLTEVIAGEEIKQKFRQVALRDSVSGLYKCRWILDNEAEYRLKDSCCKVDLISGDVACMAFTLMLPLPGCSVVRALNCRQYMVSTTDKSKKCIPTLPPLPPMPPRIPCSNSNTDIQHVAGQTIKQKFIQMFIVRYGKRTCEWTLAGSTSKEYTLRKSCTKCFFNAESRKTDCAVMDSPLAPLGCSVVQGIDCRFYFVDSNDETKMCVVDDNCNDSSKEMQQLAGKTIVQTFQQMMVVTGDNEKCKWVLTGSTPSQYRLKDNCATCSVNYSVKKPIVSCVGSPLVRPRPGCGLQRGIDCSYYATNLDDMTAPCCPTSTLAVDGVLAGRRMGTTLSNLYALNKCVRILAFSEVRMQNGVAYTRAYDENNPLSCQRCSTVRQIDGTIVESCDPLNIPDVPNKCIPVLAFDCQYHILQRDNRDKYCISN